MASRPVRMTPSTDEVAALIADFTANVSGELDPRIERAAKAVLIEFARGRAWARSRIRRRRRRAGTPIGFRLGEDGCVIWGATRRSDAGDRRARQRRAAALLRLQRLLRRRAQQRPRQRHGERASSRPPNGLTVSGAEAPVRARRRLRGRGCGLRRVLDRAGRLGLHQPDRHRRDLRDRARARPRCRTRRARRWP